MKLSINIKIVAIVLVLIVLGGGYAYNSLRDLAAVGAGVVAKNLCSAVYVSGFDYDDYSQVLAERGFTEFASSTHDPENKRVIAKASLPAGPTRVAVYTPGAGCRLTTPADAASVQLDISQVVSPSGEFTKEIPTRIEAHTQKVLNQHLSYEPATFGLLVWKDGIIRAEGYGFGISAKTPLIGWSMTKSLAHAMTGVLIHKGKLTQDSTDLLAAWRQAEVDERRNISLEDMLRMSSGLEFQELYEVGGDAVTMLFSGKNIPEYAASFPLDAPIGDKWYYSSGTTNLVGRVMTELINEPLMPYMQRELLDPLGITSMVVEADASGNPVLSSFGYATIRDWLRLGLLYLNGGTWEGIRLLPQNYPALAASLTPASDGLYGQHFWLNKPNSEGKKPYPDLPEDAYMMNGFDGQHVVIIPSLNAVVIRMGLDPASGQFDLNKVASELLGTL